MAYLSLYEQKILFERISKGDVSAFKKLFDAYRLKLYTAALRITKSDHAAEDVVQEIFVSLWDARSNLSEVAHPPAYIFAIARNISLRYLKKVAVDAQLYQTLIARTQVLRDQTNELLAVKETHDIIARAVNKLPSQRQLIYKLSREEGLTHQQIASQLDISPLTVKKQIVLALRNIRAVLGKIVLLWPFLLL